MKSQVSLAFIVLLIVSALTATAVSVAVVKQSQATGLNKQQALDTCNQYCAEEVQLMAQNPSLRYPRIIDFCKWSSDIKGEGYVRSCNGLSQCFIPSKDCYIHCAGSQAVCLPFPYTGNDINTSINTCNYLCELENEVSNVTQWHDSLYCQWRGTVVGYGDNLTCGNLTSCYLSKYGCNIECNGTMAQCPAINFTEACGNMCELENHWADMGRQYPHNSLFCSIWSDINGSRTNCTAESSCYVEPYDCYIQCNGHDADCITPCKTFDTPNTVYKMGGNKAVHTGSGTCMKIVADNVTLDCQGHEIIGDRQGVGIEVIGNNATIKNCVIKNERYDINLMARSLGGLFVFPSGVNIINNTLYITHGDGINSHPAFVYTSTGGGYREYNRVQSANIIGNKFISSDHYLSWIYLFDSVIKDNVFSSDFVIGAKNVTFTNNTIYSNIFFGPFSGVILNNSFGEPDAKICWGASHHISLYFDVEDNTSFADNYIVREQVDATHGIISNNMFNRSYLVLQGSETADVQILNNNLIYSRIVIPKYTRIVNVSITNNTFQNSSLEGSNRSNIVTSGNIFNGTYPSCQRSTIVNQTNMLE